MKRFFLFLVPFLILVGCKKDNDVSPTPTPAPSAYERGQLVQILDSASYSFTEFTNALVNSNMFEYASNYSSEIAPIVTIVSTGLKSLYNARKPVLDAYFASQVGLDCHMRPQYAFETYSFSYTTLSAQGTPMVLSGRVTFPNNTVKGVPHEVDSYTLFSHQHLLTPNWAPSQCLSIMSMRALYNSAVIEPDAQGYGVTLHTESVANLSYEARARQLADCAKAAMQILKRRDVSLAENGYSTNWGSSLGSPIALAFARYYDREATAAERKALRLKSTYVGEGPLDFASMFKFFDRTPDYHPSIEIFFLGLNALTTEQLHGYQASDFTASWKNTVTVPWQGNDYPYFYAASHLYDNYRDYAQNITPDTLFVNLLASDMTLSNYHLNMQSPKTIEFFKILGELNDFSDWDPSTEIYFAHAIDDLSIPYEQAHEVYEQVKQQASNSSLIHWFNVPSSRSLLSKIELLGVHFGVSIEAMLYMTLAKEPKNMKTFYIEE